MQDLNARTAVLVERWAAELGREPAEVQAMCAYLAAMAGVRAGILRQVWRGVRRGRPVVIVVNPRSETFFEAEDPHLGAAEERMVAEMAAALGVVEG